MDLWGDSLLLLYLFKKLLSQGAEPGIMFVDVHSIFLCLACVSCVFHVAPSVLGSCRLQTSSLGLECSNFTSDPVNFLIIVLDLGSL